MIKLEQGLYVGVLKGSRSYKIFTRKVVGDKEKGWTKCVVLCRDSV